MSFLRHDLLPLTAALLAVLAVLFVSTASTACEAPVGQGMASMSMSDDCGPCEQKTAKVSCQKACLVFCQVLIARSSDSVLARTYASIRYSHFDAAHAAFTAEADDPPPRA